MIGAQHSGRSEPVMPMRRPLVALAGAFALGVWVAHMAAGTTRFVPWILAGSILSLVMLVMMRRQGGVLRFYLWLLLFAYLGWSRGVLPAIPNLEPPKQLVVLGGVAEDGWQNLQGGRRVLLDENSIGYPGKGFRPWPGKVRLTVLPGQQAGCPAVLPGDEVRVLARIHKPYATHNHGSTDSIQALYSKGIYWTATATDCGRLLVSRKDTFFSPPRLAQEARYALDELLHSVPERHGAAYAIYSALSTGQTGNIPDETRLAFQRAGLAHLLAISGLHLGTIAIGLFWLLSIILCRVRPLALRMDVTRLAAAMVIPAVGFYVLLVGARLPAVRASIVISFFLFAVILRRKSDPLNLLSAAGLLVLGLWPQSLFSASFQLSFSAAFFVLFLAPHWAEFAGCSFSTGNDRLGFFGKVRNRIVQLFLISTAATVGTAPVVAWHFHQVSVSGLISNLFAVPLASWLVVPVGIASAVLLPFSHTLSEVSASFGIWLCHGLDWLAHFFSMTSWASFNVASAGLLSVFAWYGFWTLITLSRQAKWSRVAAGFLAVIVGTGLMWSVVENRFSSELKLTVIDVGQGDCMLLRFPGGAAWLVDGGGTYSGRYDVGAKVVAPALWALGVFQLDVIVATHRDPDHVGGLASVVRLFHPKEVWSATDLEEDDFSRKLAGLIFSEGIGVRRVYRGMNFKRFRGVVVEVLWPPEDSAEYEENERSIVLRITYGDQAMLLTGDLEKEGERGLLESGSVLKSVILKVGHHGSANATGKEFLDKVEPHWAVITVGKGNRFGLPYRDVLQRLKAAGVEVLRTDEDGQITLSTDGKVVKIDKWADEKNNVYY